jgi:hypothetical protein
MIPGGPEPALPRFLPLPPRHDSSCRERPEAVARCRLRSGPQSDDRLRPSAHHPLPPARRLPGVRRVLDRGAARVRATAPGGAR